jgi:mono/diheme cytochrome c family protein
MNRKSFTTRLARICLGFLACSAIVFAEVDARSIYLDKCSTCHGPDGQGKTAKGKKLKVKSVKDTIAKEDMAAMVKIVTDGKGADMDSFKTELKPDQIKAVVEYYRSLAQ